MPSQADTTPESRRNTFLQLEDKAKRLVRSVDPNNGRCLVENVSERRAVDFCHCIPRAAAEDDSLLDSLEWFWNMERYSLNLDTRRNIFRTGSSIHRLYDTHKWLLLPEDDILSIYIDSLQNFGTQRVACRQRFPEIPDRDDFLYRFISLGEWEDAILRQNFVPDKGTPLSSNNFTVHVYPFETLPRLRCHLHPKFVIVEGGRKISSLNLDIQRLVATYPSLDLVSALYAAWTTRLPVNWMKDATYHKPYKPPPDLDEDDGDSGEPDDDRDADYEDDKTSYGRWGSEKRSAPQETRTRKGKRRRQNLTTGQKRPYTYVLSDMTVVERGRKVGKFSWTDDAIRNWLNACECLPR